MLSNLIAMSALAPSIPHTGGAEHASAHAMQCMEIWGGNRSIENAVSMPGLDAWVYSRPFGDDIGGGDVHYVSSCATGRISRILVADVSGHGAAVDRIAVNLRRLMGRHANYIDQTKFVRALNRQFSELADGGEFATALVATYWAPTDYLTLCNAGHPRPLRRSARTGEWAPLALEERANDSAANRDAEITNLPLGILEPTAYEQFGVRLRKGDLILLYTDALIEAAAPDGRRLGESGLLHILHSLNGDTHEVLEQLLAVVADFRGGAPPDDDLTAILLRHNGARPPRMTPLAWASAFRRFLALSLESLRGHARATPWPELRIAAFGAFWGRLNNRWGDPPRPDGPGPASDDQ